MSGVLTDPPFLVFTFLTLMVVVPAGCHYWWKVRRCEMETQLKHALVERGMSADEIVKVIQATAPDEKMPSEPDEEDEPESASG